MHKRSTHDQAKKYVLRLLLCCMLILALVVSNFAGLDLGITKVKATELCGEGTETSPYKIKDYDDLKTFADIVNGTNGYKSKSDAWAVLENDIICTDKTWVPIGTNRYYTGHFDGNNKKIFYLSNEDIANVNDKIIQGLFACIGVDGEVKNIGLENGNILGNDYVGGIAGHNYGIVTNCYNTGAVSGKNYVGGIVGQNNADESEAIATVTNSYNIGAVSGTIDFVGGIVGWNNAHESGAIATVTNSYNTGTVSGNYDVGGVVGNNHALESGAIAIVTNSYNTGAVSGTDYYVGGVVGCNAGVSATVSNCYFDNDRSTGIESVGMNFGIFEGSSVKGLKTSEMTGIEAFSEGHIQFSYDNPNDNPWLLMKNDDNNCFYPHLNGVNFELKTNIPETRIVSSTVVSVKDWPARILSGSTNGGSQDNPYEISDYNMLKQFSDIVNGTNGYTSNTSACAVLTNDIICTDKKWVPIGYDDKNDGENEFYTLYAGTFDGLNHKIIGLNNTEVENIDQLMGQGLFGYNTGTIQNVGLVDCEIKGLLFIGSIAGLNYSSDLGMKATISNCYNTGNISGHIRIGGIVGKNLVKNKATTTILDCYNLGIISGHMVIGGIVGNNDVKSEGAATVSKCFNAGIIHGDSSIGGIVGLNNIENNAECFISCSYNLGDITGESNIGGIAGDNPVSSNGTMSVLNCYNSGTLNIKSSSSGGLIGHLYSPGGNTSIINSYNTGDVIGDLENSRCLGGITGEGILYNGILNIANCYNTGKVIGYDTIGGLLGAIDLSESKALLNITNCYNTGNTFAHSGQWNIFLCNCITLHGGRANVTNCYYNQDNCNQHMFELPAYDESCVYDIKALTTARMTGSDALSEYGMLFEYDTENGEVNPWIVKADELNEKNGNYTWYYPHLKGFNYFEVEENEAIVSIQKHAEEINADEWPAKINCEENWSVAATDKQYDGIEIKPSIDAINLLIDDTNTKSLSINTDYQISYKKLVDDSWQNSETTNNAGKYKTCLAIPVTDKDGKAAVYYRDIIGDFSIYPKPITIVAQADSKTFGGTDPIDYLYKVTGLIDGDTLTGTLAREKGENAGTYDIILNTLKNDNYNITFTGAIFTIDPKPLGDEAVGLSETEFTYDGSAHTPEVTVLDGTKEVSSNEYSVDITNNVNAGTATVTIKNVDDGNYTIDVTKTFNINKKNAVILESPKAISDLKYNGLEQSLITAGNAEDSCVILYALGTDATTAPAADDENATDAEKKWSTSIPSGTDSGTYYVWYKVAEDKNHIDSDASCITVTINKAKATVKADDITITYGEAIPTLTAKVTGLADIDKEKQGVIKYTVSRDEGTDVDSYIITPSGDAEQGNYTVRYETGTLTIIKQLGGILENPKAVSGLVYNGVVQKLLTAGTAEDGITIYYALGNDNTTAPEPDADDAPVKAWSTTIPVAANAGTYYIWFKAVADDNHDVNSAEAVCIPVTVEKASVNVKAVDLSKTYGTADAELSATITGLAEGDSEDLITYTISRTAGESVGTYTITPTGEVEQGNYSVSFSTGTYTITTSTESVFNITLSQDTYTYDGPEKTPTVTVTVGNTEIPASEYKVTISDNINAGTATVTVSDVAGGNYNVSGTATFNIAKADISPVLSINGWKEGEEAESPSITGNTDNGTITYTYKLKDADESAYVATVPTSAGTYTVKAEIAPTDNYNGAVVTADFVIEKKAEPEPEPGPEPQPQPVVNTPVNTEPALPYTTNNTVTNNDGSKTTTDTTYNADYSITKKSVREWKNGKKTTNITLTDKDNKELINVSQVIETGKSGTKKVTTNIIEANSYHYYNELKTAKSGKQTNITDITDADKSSSYVKMITYPDEKVVRNSIDTTSKGISTIAIGTYATGTSTGTSGSTKKNNTDIATSIGFIGTFNSVGTKVDAKTIESVEKLIANSFEFTDNALSDTAVVETEMTYKATSRNTAKLIKCKTSDSEITVPSKVVINGKSYKVYAVAKNAFNGCDNLTKVTLGKTITTIGVKAFADLESLSEIVFNSKSKDGIKIGKGAFNGISEEAQFYMNASKAARDKTANRIKESGYGNDVTIIKK